MKRTQIGWVVIVVCMVVVAIALLNVSNVQTRIFMISLVMLLLLLFFQLTIVVTTTYVRFYMGIGIIRKTFYFSTIESCRAVEYFTLGWGIRFRPGVVVFNVNGNKAIEIQTKNNSNSFWIGTDCPNELVAYINEQRKKVSDTDQ